MKSKDFVIRKDKKAITIHEDGFVDADEILEKDYPYIFDAIEKEDYIMEETQGDYFKEILFEDKVVGFAVYENTEIGFLSLIQVYIMPEFRGNKLFLNEISSLFKRGIGFFISQPNRRLVEILIHYGLAKKIRDNIAVSAIEFEIPTYCMESSIDSFEKDYGKIYISNVYALDICSTLIIEEIPASGDFFIIYQTFLDDDDDYYDCIDRRDELINDEYFDNVKDFFLNDHEEFVNAVVELKEQLPVCEEGFRSIVWDEDGLSTYMQNMVDNNVLSKKRAFEIKEQLDYEYNQGMVTDEGILTRLYFLIDNNIRQLNEEEMLDLLLSDDVVCPYCYVTSNLSDRFCKNCGYNLYYDEPDDSDEVDFEQILPLIDILSEENEEKQFAKFINLMVEDKNMRDAVFDSSESDDEFREFFDMIDEDPQMKNFFTSSLTDDNYDENKFLGELNDEIQGNDDFLNFFEKYGYLEEEDNQPMTINSFEDLIALIGRGYALDDDCPTCYDNQVFKILKFVGEGYNIEIPFIMDDSLDPALKDFLIREEYVSGNVTKETWNDFAQDFTVPQLKNILRKNNLKVSGRKQELIDRLADADISFDDFYTDKYFITDKGRDFLKAYYWIDIFNENMKHFDFDDFSFFMENHEGEFSDAAQDYLDEHLKMAFQYHDFDYLLDCYQTKCNLYLYFEDFKNVCKCNLKMFSLGVNPIYYEDSGFGYPLKGSVIDSLIDLSEAFGKSKVLKSFDKVWDEMDFKEFVVDKKEARNILKDLLDNEDLDEYNDYLCESLENFFN